MFGEKNVRQACPAAVIRVIAELFSKNPAPDVSYSMNPKNQRI
jgi:hypothetical protein